jgi:hypothetical protein
MHTPRKILVAVAVIRSTISLSVCSTTANPGTTGSFAIASAIFHKANNSFATDMAKTEVDSGKNAEDVKVAKNIISTQTGEITQMSSMLASL